ncbi:hypothetical protein BGZ72_000797, partial [Mortierella alpina]
MTYNLKDPDTPIVSGRLLAVLTNVVERIGEPTGIISHLCNDAGLYVLRTKDYAETPTTMPIVPPTDEMVQAAASDDTSTVSAQKYLISLQQQADQAAAAYTAASARTGEHRFLTCRDFYVAYKSGRKSPTEVAEQLIELIEESDQLSPPLGAVWNWRSEDILRQAKASALRYSEGKPLSIVDGVPIVVKDEIDVESYETGVGTNYINKGNPAKEDAHLVALLRAHGAIIVGKSTMHEIGLGITNFNPSTKTPRNPYQPMHSTGGSSGGSGAAVGAGLCPIAIGCDGGGSVRIPASYCGIYGLKPTQGRVSARGEYPLAPTVATSGPMCATMEDLAIVYAIIAGQDEQDFNSRSQPPVALPTPLSASLALKGQLQGLRIGIYRRWFEDVTHPEIAQTCYRMLERLCKDQGAILVDIEIPELFENGKAHNITICAEMLSKVHTDRKKLNHQTRLELAMADSLRLQDYYRAQQQRTRSIRFLESLFGHKATDKHHLSQYPCPGGHEGVVDVIVTPTIANLPTRVNAGALSHGESNYLNNVKTMQYMMMANFTGIPGITAVAGYSKETYTQKDGCQYGPGFPIGIQFMGQWWDEKRLIHIASVCERVLETRLKPKIWIKAMVAAAKAKATAAAEALKAQRQATQGTQATPPAGAALSPADIIRQRAEAVKARLQNLNAARPTAAASTAPSASVAAASTTPADPRARGGLGVDLSAMISRDEAGNLIINSVTTGKNVKAPSFATAKVNQKPEPKKALKLLDIPEDFTDQEKNPYFDPNLRAAPRERVARPLKFAPKGKYKSIANQIRAEQRIEQLRREIEQGGQANVQEEDLQIKDGFTKREDLKDGVEWWDAAFLPNKTYDDISKGHAKIETEDSLITHYIQHPVPIEPPNEAAHAASAKPRPLMLTTKERKKLRRQRRRELLKEKQDKIRLGLLPPDAPKVKLANMMRVLGQEAVLNPTEIEMK